MEITAHSNESVEPGAPILRVSRFSTVIAQVFVPASESVPATAKEAKITPYASTGNPLNAVRIGVGPARDPKTKEAVLMFRVTVDDPSQHVRPGTPVGTTTFINVANSRSIIRSLMGRDGLSIRASKPANRLSPPVLRR